MHDLITSEQSRPSIGLNAHLLSRAQSYRSAGVSRYIDSLLTFLPQVDTRAEYVALLGDSAVECPGWSKRVSRWPTRHPVSRILWEQLGQPWVGRRRGLDLLHVPVNVGPILAPCPIVVTVHDLSFCLQPDLFHPSKRIYLQTLTRHTVRRARGVIAVSESTRQDLIRVLGIPPDRIVVVPNGVDDRMRPVENGELLRSFRAQHELPERFVLFVGTLEPRKNLVTLLQAYAKLRGRGRIDHALVLVGGKGWYYSEIYATAERLRLREHVLFAGFVPQEELPLWYNAADVFVYPSLYEGFGLPPLEAMACGTPVISSNVSAMPEVVGDAGLLVDPHDADAIAEALFRVLQDAQLHSFLRSAGIERASAYTWRATAQRTSRVYHQLLGGHAAYEA